MQITQKRMKDDPQFLFKSCYFVIDFKLNFQNFMGFNLAHAYTGTHYELYTYNYANGPQIKEK